jgi:hypothetical protein
MKDEMQLKGRSFSDKKNEIIKIINLRELSVSIEQRRVFCDDYDV